VLAAAKSRGSHRKVTATTIEVKLSAARAQLKAARARE